MTEIATLPAHLDVLAAACGRFAGGTDIDDLLTALLESALALCPGQDGAPWFFVGRTGRPAWKAAGRRRA